MASSARSVNTVRMEGVIRGASVRLHSTPSKPINYAAIPRHPARERTVRLRKGGIHGRNGLIFTGDAMQEIFEFLIVGWVKVEY